MKKFEFSKDQIIEIIKDKANVLTYIKYEDFDIDIKNAILEDETGDYLSYLKIEEETEDMQDLIIKKDPSQIHNVTNPSTRLIKTTLNENPCIIGELDSHLTSEEIKEDSLYSIINKKSTNWFSIYRYFQFSCDNYSKSFVEPFIYKILEDEKDTTIITIKK